MFNITTLMPGATYASQHYFNNTTIYGMDTADTRLNAFQVVRNPVTIKVLEYKKVCFADSVPRQEVRARLCRSTDSVRPCTR